MTGVHFEDLVSAYARMRFPRHKPSLIRFCNWAELLRKGQRPLKRARIRLPSGSILLNLDINKWLQREVFYHGYFEFATQSIIQQYCTPSSTVVDVGANIGLYTVQMSKLVGEHGKVIAFEPVSRFHSELLENLSLNRCTNVTVEKVAASDDGEEKLVSVIDQTASIALYGGAATTESVPSVRLDDYLKTEERTDFIKIDVDGWDLHVLAGASETLYRSRPYVIVECLQSADAPPSCIWELLSQHSYKVFVDSDLRRMLSLSEFQELCAKRQSINVFAVPKESGIPSLF